MGSHLNTSDLGRALCRLGIVFVLFFCARLLSASRKATVVISTIKLCNSLLHPVNEAHLAFVFDAGNIFQQRPVTLPVEAELSLSMAAKTIFL